MSNTEHTFWLFTKPTTVYKSDLVLCTGAAGVSAAIFWQLRPVTSLLYPTGQAAETIVRILMARRMYFILFRSSKY